MIDLQVINKLQLVIGETWVTRMWLKYHLNVSPESYASNPLGQSKSHLLLKLAILFPILHTTVYVCMYAQDNIRQPPVVNKPTAHITEENTKDLAPLSCAWMFSNTLTTAVTFVDHSPYTHTQTHKQCVSI